MSEQPVPRGEGAAMTVTVNGQPQRVDPGETRLGSLLARLGFAQRPGIAVAVNDSVVPRSAWGETEVQAGDRLEIVVAVQGG